MLCSVLESTRISLYSSFERPLNSAELKLLRGYVQRRAHSEPLQYILEQADFYSLQFHVTPDVLIPRPETEHIVERVISLSTAFEKPQVLCMDIGTGSGCIPIAVAHHTDNTQWLAVDLDQDALDVAHQNIDRYDLHDRVSLARLDILADMPSKSFDVITMNPPYIPSSEVSSLQPEVRDYEPHIALTDDGDGLTFYRRLAEIAPSVLSDGGFLVMELGWKGAESVQQLFGNGWQTEVIDDLSGIPRVLVVSRSKLTVDNT